MLDHPTTAGPALAPPGLTETQQALIEALRPALAGIRDDADRFAVARRMGVDARTLGLIWIYLEE